MSEHLTEEERDWLISGIEINSTVKAMSVPLRKLRELFDAKEHLKTAVRYLKEGKARFTPETTNSDVDVFLERFRE